MGKTIAIASRKGGVGKTTTAVNLAVGLARQGKSVFALDLDPQGSMTVSFGVKDPEKRKVTVGSVMTDIINEQEVNLTGGYIRHTEDVYLLPNNNSLSGVELLLGQMMMNRESVLRQYVETVKADYDYIVIDCSPNLGLLTLNALVAADSVIIPVVPKFLDAKGLESLLKTVAQVKRQLNPKLEIDGILLTMVDRRANFTREVISSIENAYGGNIKIFGERIPRSVRVTESSANGVSIFAHDPNGKVSAAYSAIVEGVLSND
ncbi:sporulation initiation inhibitor Soj [Clostridia bacterium]|nr:sporulation initiation inhibitor Soj [Clostridia bacterium]